MMRDLQRWKSERVMTLKLLSMIVLAVLTLLVLPHGSSLAQEHFLVTHYPEYRPTYDKLNHPDAVKKAERYNRVRVERRTFKQDKVFATTGPYQGQRVVLDHYGNIVPHTHKTRLEAEHKALENGKIYQARGINTRTGRQERGFVRAEDTRTGVYYIDANGQLVNHYLPRDRNSFNLGSSEAREADLLSAQHVMPSASAPMNKAMLDQVLSGQVRVVNGEFRLHTGELVVFDGGGGMRVIANAQPAYGFVPPQNEGVAPNVAPNVVQQVVQQQPVVTNIPGYQAPNAPLQ